MEEGARFGTEASLQKVKAQLAFTEQVIANYSSVTFICNVR